MPAGHCTPSTTCIRKITLSDEPDVPSSGHVYIHASASSIHSMNVQLVLKQRDTQVQPFALLDSGAYSCFMHYRFVQDHKLAMRPLKRQVRVFNADATENKKGLITHYARCQVRIGNHTSWQSFLIAEIGHHDIIIGMSFLREHNPEIDWKEQKINFTRCPTECAPNYLDIQEEDLDQLEIPRLEVVAQDQYGDLERGDRDDPETFMHYMTHSDDPDARILRNDPDAYMAQYGKRDKNPVMANAPEVGKPDDAWKDTVPKHYHKHGIVFSKEASYRMPTRKPYDHAIELIPGASLPKHSTPYPMNKAERNALDEWINEQRAKGYI